MKTIKEIQTELKGMIETRYISLNEVCIKIRSYLRVENEKTNICLIFQREFQTCKDEFHKGLLSFEEFSKHENRIMTGILDIINHIEDKDLRENEEMSHIVADLIEEATRLKKHIEDLQSSVLPLESQIKRGEKIIKDLRLLLDMPIEKIAEMTIWSISFLSIFSITKNDKYVTDKKLLLLLNEEKKLLLDLASRGCRIKCIISPANEHYISSRIEYATYRTEQLIKFLESKDENTKSALKNIEWAYSQYGQGNVYILGNTSFYLGYKKGVDATGIGYDFSLRLSYEGAIKSHIEIYKNFFDNLSCKNLVNWCPGGDIYFDAIDLRRKATISKLGESLKFLERIKDTTKTNKK